MSIQSEFYQINQRLMEFVENQDKIASVMEDMMSRVIVLESVVFEQTTKKVVIVKFRPTETDPGNENSENP